jgi:hypothetical protein
MLGFLEVYRCLGLPGTLRVPHLLPLIPAVHGIGAMSTFLLTVTAALLPVR